MSNFNIRINGGANLSQAKGEFAKLEAQVDRLNAAMERSVMIQGKVNPNNYATMARAVKENSTFSRNAALSTGMFEVQQLRLNSATEKYTELIQKQKLTFGDMIRDRKQGRALAAQEIADLKAQGVQMDRAARKRLAFSKSIAGAAYKEQMALRQMVAQQMPGTAGGKKVLDVYIPNEVHKDFDTLRNRIGFVREELKAASTQMVNWGKNTQWAGRQLMVGFTVPTLAFGAATGALAYQVDKEMTRIQKVYDTTAQVVKGDQTSMIAVEQELARVRVASMNTARIAASQYGQSIKETLSVQASLAATGLKGSGLQQGTLETMRISTLGELDTDSAINMTVALQSAFKDTIKTSGDLSNAFNYMNAVENATSLSIADIAEAIPRAGSAMAALGVSVEEMTVLMTSMKEAGVDAAEGANALKSATGTILKPSPAADDFIKQISNGKVQVMELAQASGGNLYKALEILFTQMKDAGMDATEQQQTLVALFGKYQYNRMAGILNNFGDAVDGFQNQTRKAMDLTGKSTTELADLSEQEMSRFQNSLSGRFKTAIETIKADLVEMGKPFLEMGVVAIGVISKIVQAFNSMPDSVKKTFAALAVGAAILGPLVMLTGLAANFGGSLIKMGVTVIGLATNFKLLDKESQAATLAARLAEQGFLDEGTALARLTAEMKAMTQAAEAGALAQKQFMLANSRLTQLNGVDKSNRVGVIPSQPFMGTSSGTRAILGAGLSPMSAPYSGPVQSPSGRRTDSVAGSIPNPSHPVPIVTDTDVKNSRETSKWLHAGAASAGIAAASMATMALTSNQTANNMAQFAMVASLTAPLFSGMAAGLKAVPWASIGTTLSTKWAAGATAVKSGFAAAATEVSLMASNMTSRQGISYEMGVASSRARSLASGAKSGLGSILGMVSPIGWVGAALAAGAASMYLLQKHAQKASDNVKTMYADASGLGDILGYAPNEGMQTTMVDKQGNSMVGMSAKVQAFQEKYASVVSKIAATAKTATGEQEAFNYAMAQGMKVIQTGGTAEQAKAAVEIALRAAKSKSEAEKILLHFDAQLDFSNSQNQVDAAIAMLQQHLDDAKGDLSEINSDPGFGNFLHTAEWGTNISDKFPDWASYAPSEGEINRIKQEMAQAGQAASNAYNVAMDNGLGTQQVADAAQKTLDALNREIANAEGGTMAHYAAVQKREAFIAALVKGRIEDEGDYADNLSMGASVLDIMGDANMEIVGATKESANNVDDLADNYGKGTKEAKRLTAQQRSLNREIKAAKAVDWASEYKSMMEDTQSEIADIASENFDNRMNSAMDAYKASQDARMNRLEAAGERANQRLQASQEKSTNRLENAQEKAANALERSQERQTDAFEARWERRKNAVEHAFDARINKVQNAIKAEQKAEETRKRIFEAEMQRVQRMAEMANTNIDFNVAINKGDLDEAAKIRNNMQAKESDWALGDAMDASERASQARVDRLEKKSDAIEAQKDKRLEAMAKAEEAEKKSLERRQEREKKFLEKQQEREKKALEKRQAAQEAAQERAQKKQEAALQRETENNVAAQQEIWENRKNKLDKAIELFRSYVPKNEKDLREHVARIAAKYSDFNVTTRGKFNKTSVEVGHMLSDNVKEATRKIKDDIKWEGVGSKIAKDMIRGAFGMSPNQFQNWLVTGDWPKGAKIGTGADKGGSGPRNKFEDENGMLAYHTGGIVGVDKGGQAGIRRGHNDEVKATLLRGEGVLNRKAMSKIGPTGFRALNSGVNSSSNVGPRDAVGGEGSFAGLGIGGIMGAMMFRAVAKSIGIAAQKGAQARQAKDAALLGGSGSFSGGKAGKYADRSFNDEQMKNATTIANVGKSMGMSTRDIEIGIMTAITESGLINIHGGDRDSQGLFQQRPSMGWGTVAQVTDPKYAARAFFTPLKAHKERDSESPWLAAQHIQRSAFASGSNYKQYWDNAVAIFKGLKSAAGSVGAGFVEGAGGWHRASVGGKGWSNSHDYRNGIGSPLYAASDGTITDSRAITSGGSAGNGKYRAPNGQPYRSYGETIAMRTASGDILRYAHLSPGARFVRVGQHVKGGSLIGRSGETGNAWGAHTHFDVNGNYDAKGWMSRHGISLSKGAQNIKWDNTVANLHKGEAVLTEDINTQFREGVRRFAEGPNAQYNLHMTVNGQNINVDELVGKTTAALRRMERRKPQSRSI